MDDELVKVKYQVLVENLYLVKNKFADLENCYNELFSTVKEGMTINDKIVCEDVFNNLMECNNIKEELIDEIIPRVNNRV